jgi:hypothetical protein
MHEYHTDQRFVRLSKRNRAGLRDKECHGCWSQCEMHEHDTGQRMRMHSFCRGGAGRACERNRKKKAMAAVGASARCTKAVRKKAASHGDHGVCAATAKKKPGSWENCAAKAIAASSATESRRHQQSRGRVIAKSSTTERGGLLSGGAATLHQLTRTTAACAAGVFMLVCAQQCDGDNDVQAHASAIRAALAWVACRYARQA